MTGGNLVFSTPEKQFVNVNVCNGKPQNYSSKYVLSVYKEEVVVNDQVMICHPKLIKGTVSRDFWLLVFFMN
jgi:hypothetical protein